MFSSSTSLVIHPDPLAVVEGSIARLKVIAKVFSALCAKCEVVFVSCVLGMMVFSALLLLFSVF